MTRDAYRPMLLAALVGLALGGTACKPEPPPRPATPDAGAAAARPTAAAPASQRLPTEMKSSSYRITDISIQGTDMGGATPVAPAPGPKAPAPGVAPGPTAPAPAAPKAPAPAAPTAPAPAAPKVPPPTP
jgi:hypothetical protein